MLLTELHGTLLNAGSEKTRVGADGNLSMFLTGAQQTKPPMLGEELGKARKKEKQQHNTALIVDTQQQPDRPEKNRTSKKQKEKKMR